MSLFASLGKKLGRLTVSGTSSAGGGENGGEEGEGRAYLDEPHVSASLVTGSMRKMVGQPSVSRAPVQGAWEETFVTAQKEWLAVNTFDFVHLVSELHGATTYGCRCASLTGVGGVEYAWTHGTTSTRSAKLSAQQHADLAMTWITAQLDSDAVFPTRAGVPFPRDFDATVRAILRLLFRLLSHIYHAHYEAVLALELEAHLNTVFAHLVAFGKEFDLLDKKEIAPLSDLIDILLK